MKICDGLLIITKALTHLMVEHTLKKILLFVLNNCLILFYISKNKGGTISPISMYEFLTFSIHIYMLCLRNYLQGIPIHIYYIKYDTYTTLEHTMYYTMHIKYYLFHFVYQRNIIS